MILSYSIEKFGKCKLILKDRHPFISKYVPVIPPGILNPKNSKMGSNWTVIFGEMNKILVFYGCLRRGKNKKHLKFCWSHSDSKNFKCHFTQITNLRRMLINNSQAAITSSRSAILKYKMKIQIGGSGEVIKEQKEEDNLLL